MNTNALYSEESVLAEINEWCAYQNVRPFRAEHLGHPDGDGTRVVGLVPQLSYVEPGKAGMITFRMGRVDHGVVTPRYTTSRRIHSWMKGLKPVETEAVLAVCLIRTPHDIFCLFADTYRVAMGGSQLECARGYASDIDYRGEEAGYADIRIPERIWKPRLPTDSILGLAAARAETDDEILGQALRRRYFYLGCFPENDTFAHMWNGVFLVTAEVEDLALVRPGNPDSTQRGSLVAVPIADLREVLHSRVIGPSVTLSVTMAETVLEKVRCFCGDISPLWTGVWPSF